jgi:small-conductance mechanosensitive channel
MESARKAAKPLGIVLLASWLCLAAALPFPGWPYAAAHAAEAKAPAVADDAGDKEKREQDRRELVGQAEEFIHGVDAVVQGALPGRLGTISGTVFLNIPLWRYLAVACLILLGFGLITAVDRRFRQTLAAAGSDRSIGAWQRFLDILFLALRNPARLILFALLLRWVSGIAVTSFHPDIIWLSNLLLTLSIAVYFFDLVGLADRIYGDRLFKDRLMITVRPILLKTMRVLILLVAAMQIYQSVTGQTMLSLLAGLGIGGLALALASQETLKNLLGFASIALDKVFLVGDGVIIAGFEGVVTHVGLRSIRLQLSDGSSVIIPNSAAVGSNIVNKSRRPRLKLDLRFGLGVANPFAKIEGAMEAIGTMLEGTSGRAPGSVPEIRIASYDPGRIVLQAVFWFDPAFSNIQAETDRLNLEIGRRLAELGIVLA